MEQVVGDVAKSNKVAQREHDGIDSETTTTTKKKKRISWP